MKITFVKSFLPAVVAAASLTLASSAFSPANAYGVTPTGAITLNSGDKGRTLDPMKWLVPQNTVGSTGKLPVNLSAQAVVKVDDLNDKFIDLSINLLNTTQKSFQAAIVSFGLAIDPDATGVTVLNKQNTLFDSAELQTGQQNFPGGFKGIDICAFAANNCSGGDIKDGLQAGGSDIIKLRIGGNFSSGVTIASYPMKFQTAVGSFEAAGVPEPITVVGSGLALGFGALFKREISKKRNKAKVKS